MHSSIFSTGKNLIHAMRLLYFRVLIPLIIFIFYNVKIVFKKWEIKSCCSLFHMLGMSLHNMSLTSDRLSEVLQSILPVFDINSLRIEQEMALYAFLTVKDVLIFTSQRVLKS